LTSACIFDLDGVLVDNGAWHREAWTALLREEEVPEPPEAWRLTIGRPAEEAVPLLLGRRVSSREAWRLASRKREFYVEIARRGARPVRGVTAFVERLAVLGVPRAVGTSASGQDVARLLAEIGLRRQFRVVVTADDVTLGKPDPEVYRLAAARLSVPAAACVVFEDSVVGIQAAGRAGMRAVGVTTGYEGDELLAAGAERVIPDFEGLEWTDLATR
jgi:HAD superfamily hydrolase (TIGR01509 family)